jgi:hypothetical protein
MDVICKIGRRFHDLEAAKRCSQHHSGGCGECEGTYWIPLPPITPSPKEPQQQPEITEQENDIRQSEDKTGNQCPSSRHRTKEEFPCPRCCYSESISEMGYFFKTTTFWKCWYPKIVNWDMVNPIDIVKPPDDTEDHA